MSDEPDGAAGEDAAETAALTQPLRPTGKRSRQRSGAGTALAEAEVTDEALTEEFEAVGDGKKKSKKDRGGKTRNPFVFVWTYLGQVVAELRKVIWPNRKQMVSYTSVVLVFLIFMVALISVTDLGWHRLVLLVFG